MAGKASAVKSGDELKRKVVELGRKLGLKVQTEVTAARRLWGAKRRIDVMLTHEKTGKSLGIECKYQGGRGTAEEKIPATLKDIEFWPIDGIIVIAGSGFSPNIQGYLMSTGKVIWLEDLEDWLILYFSLPRG